MDFYLLQPIFFFVPFVSLLLLKTRPNMQPAAYRINFYCFLRQYVLNPIKYLFKGPTRDSIQKHIKLKKNIVLSGINNVGQTNLKINMKIQFNNNTTISQLPGKWIIFNKKILNKRNNLYVYFTIKYLNIPIKKLWAV